MSVTASSDDLFLDVQNSNFTRNSANGGLSGCPADAAQPCSAWGGAIAAFEMSNVTISGCIMTGNSAQASVPTLSQQFNASRNAVAGGGCVSVLFSGNSSGSNVKFSGSTFLSCTVTVGNTVYVGNGIRCCCACVDIVVVRFLPGAYLTRAQHTAALYRSTLVCRPGCSCWTCLSSTSCSRITCSPTAL